jgi:hypothetical protein
MFWGVFWAIFSQTHLVNLIPEHVCRQCVHQFGFERSIHNTMVDSQDDQMVLRKHRPKCSPTYYFLT